MAKKYIVDISVYPYSYDVEAENQEDAEEKAKKLFFEEVNGRSIYEIETTEELS